MYICTSKFKPPLAHTQEMTGVGLQVTLVVYNVDIPVNQYGRWKKIQYACSKMLNHICFDSVLLVSRELIVTRSWLNFNFQLIFKMGSEINYSKIHFSRFIDKIYYCGYQKPCPLSSLNSFIRHWHEQMIEILRHLLAFSRLRMGLGLDEVMIRHRALLSHIKVFF